MTFTELRNTIAESLYEALDGAEVVMSDQVQPESDYPYIYYQPVQMYMPGARQHVKVKNDEGTVAWVREEYAEATFSFTACGLSDNTALQLADKAYGYFLHTGKLILLDRGVSVIEVTNAQNRTAVVIDETDRRYGFDVRFRYFRSEQIILPTIASGSIVAKE